MSCFLLSKLDDQVLKNMRNDTKVQSILYTKIASYQDHNKPLLCQAEHRALQIQIQKIRILAVKCKLFF
jgi:hypothetical protein